MSTAIAAMKVVLAADSFLIGDGLAALLGARDDICVLGQARDHEGLLELVKELEPDAVIISIRTPVITTPATIAAARRLRVEHPALGVVVISDRGDGFALELLHGGASRVAYLLDDRLPGIETVVSALREVCEGQTVLDPSIVDSIIRRREGAGLDDLTLREADVLEQIAHAQSNRAIAATLNLSVKGVEKHVTTIFRKLALADQKLVDRRVAAALLYLRAHANAFG